MTSEEFINIYIKASETMLAHEHLKVRLDEDHIIDATIFVHRRWLDLDDPRAEALKYDATLEAGYQRALGRLYELGREGVLTP